MAKARIKKNTLNLNRQLQGAASKSSREIKRSIVGLVKDDYAKGVSPVKGYNKFAQYAVSTSKKKGIAPRRSPVTIDETGQLLDSLTAVQKGFNSVQLFFKGARNSKIARFLTFGTANMDARPLLPSFPGATFKKRILDRITKIVERNLSKIK